MARNPRNPTNQIQVELKLLQDKNVQLLKDFGDQWVTGATALSRDIQQLMGQRSGTLPAVAAGGEHASTVLEAQQATEGAMRARSSSREGEFVTTPGGARVWQPLNAVPISAPSAAAAAAMANMARPSTALPATPGMLRRAWGSMRGAAQSMFPTESADMYGSMIGSMFGGENSMMGMLLGGMAGRALGSGKSNMRGTAGLAGAGLLLATAQQNIGFGGLPIGASNLNYNGQTFGNSFGLDPGGILFTGLGSEAWKATQQAQIEASHRGRWTIDQIPGYNQTLGRIPFVGQAFGALGFSDPKYNSKQAQEAMSLTTAYGWGNPEDPYSSAMQDTMLDYMARWSKETPGMPQEAMMQLMEPTRFGTGTFEGAQSAITGLAEAARAAHMELGVFTERTLSAAQAMSQQSGVPFQTAVKDITAFSTATGLPPEAAQGFMTDTGGYLDMSRTGKGFWDTFYGKGANVGKMRGQLSILGELAQPRFWQSIKDNPAALAAAKERLAIWHKGNPEILGGMSPPEFLAMMLRGKSPVDKMRGIRHIQDAVGTDNMAIGLEMAGESREMVGTYRSIIDPEGMGKGGLNQAELDKLGVKHGAMASFIKKHGMFEKGDDAADRRKDAKRLGQWIIGKDARTGKGVKDAQKVTLDIKAPYDQIFTQMIQKHKDKARSNADPKAKGSRGGSWYDSIIPDIDVSRIDENADELLDKAGPFDPRNIPDDAKDLWDKMPW